MNDPIEAMARAITLSDGANPDGKLWPSDDPLWHGAIPTATAAYQALRDTLEPVGWRVRRLNGKGYGRRDSVIDAAIYDPSKLEFWLNEEARDNHEITPLFALPELKP